MSLRSDLKKLSPEDWRNERIKAPPAFNGRQPDLRRLRLPADGRTAGTGQSGVALHRKGYPFLEANLPCLIENEQGEPIGFLNICQWSAESDTSSWSCFIGRRHQKKGCGKAAAQLAVHILKAAAPEKPIKLATEAQNLPAQSLYVSLGFQKLPEMDGDDLVFAL